MRTVERIWAPKRPTCMPNRWMTTLLALALLATLEGCSDPSAAPGACPEAIQLDGRTYVARDTVPRQDPTKDMGIRGVCEDVDPAEGMSFPSGGEAVAISTFEGFDVESVIGAEGREGEFYVYLAEDVSERRADKIVRHLVSNEEPR
jgi:hypothetical protein